MKKLAMLAVLSLVSVTAMAGDPSPAPVPVDEPGILGLLAMSLAVVGAIKLRNALKK